MAGFDLNSLLNAKSKNTIRSQATQTEQAEGFKVVMLDVEDLMPSKDNFYSTENIDELALSIELVGHIEQNLVVKPEAHGKYEVIAGHRRRLAALKLLSQGKEEYRQVPCLIKKETDTIKDKLSLIFTNATARQLSDWEKIQQAKELKEVLLEYKQALQEENKDKPKEEREKMGRIRDIIASMLNTSTTQVGRMESIDNNLSSAFKEELEKGNIGISTAHELSRLNEKEQKRAYEQYEEKGQLHIKDVKQKNKEEVSDKAVEQVQGSIVPESNTKSDPHNKNEDKKVEGNIEEEDQVLGQRNISDYPEYMPQPQEKDLSFTEWIYKKYGISQFNMVKREIHNVIIAEVANENICPKEWEDKLTNAMSLWIMNQTKEYQKYLQK